MNRNILARVILSDAGEIHIAMKNNQSIYCSASSLYYLFTEPHEFVASIYKKYHLSTRYIVELRKNVIDVPGLTLATVYDDAMVEISFSALLKEAVKEPNKLKEEYLSLESYRYKTDFVNQREYYIRMFLDLSNSMKSDISIQQKVPLMYESQEQIMREMLNSGAELLAPEKQVIPESDYNNASVSTSDIIVDAPVRPSNMITISEYAALLGVTHTTVFNWIKKNKLHSAKKGTDGKWYIDIKEPKPSPRHKGRADKADSTGRKRIRLQGTSYEDVQKYIKERKIVTDAVRPFIRTYDEIKYYETNNYHEVEWNGRSALIIDINPYYYCKRLKKTNRELILEGHSPVVPSSEDSVYQLHHIGQRTNSPFAILPEMVHVGAETTKIFHQGKSTTDDLHSPSFYAESAAFWKTYLSEYEKHMRFSRIPFKNSKHTKDRR